MRKSSSTSSSQNHVSRVESQHSDKGEIFVLGLWGVRYQVEDVVRSVVFYTERVGFKLDQQNLPAFAQVSVGHLKLILISPGASCSRLMPVGRKQDPAAWNRIHPQVEDLPARIQSLQKPEVRLRIRLDVV